MKVLEQDSRIKNSIITIGKFDGFHLGHRLLLKELAKTEYKDYNRGVVSLYFGNKRILSTEESDAFLEGTDIDFLDVIPFDDRIKAMSCEDFIRDYIIDRYDASYIVVGEDFRFGAGRKGDVETLREAGKLHGFKVISIPKLMINGDIVSSTLIRNCLSEGSVDKVATLLGEPYGFSGTVGHGKMLGRTLGFPTANLYPSNEKLLPRFGVYASEAVIEGVTYKGITNIGIRPTVDGEESPDVEMYIFDFDRDIYDKSIRIDLKSFIREEKHFSSLDELKDQMSRDITAAKTLL